MLNLVYPPDVLKIANLLLFVTIMKVKCGCDVRGFAVIRVCLYSELLLAPKCYRETGCCVFYGGLHTLPYIYIVSVSSRLQP